MITDTPAGRFRPAPGTVIRGSVSCLTLGAAAGAAVAFGLFTCVAAIVVYAPL